MHLAVACHSPKRSQALPARSAEPYNVEALLKKATAVWLITKQCSQQMACNSTCTRQWCWPHKHARSC